MGVVGQALDWLLALVADPTPSLRATPPAAPVYT